jgi:hypothetical protein
MHGGPHIGGRLGVHTHRCSVSVPDQPEGRGPTRRSVMTTIAG